MQGDRGCATLERFSPLPRILSFDDFDFGVNGWCQLIGNYNAEGALNTVPPHKRDFRPPQLSNCSFFDIGTHGAMTGRYAMKLATRAVPGHTAVAIKRLTMRERSRVRFETYFTYSAEATLGHGSSGEDGWDGNAHPSEEQFGCFTLGSDFQDVDGVRYHCVMRYRNADDQGQLVQRWQYPTVVEPTPMEVVRSGIELDPLADFTAPSPADWVTLPGTPQPLCYNEVPTKINWHYLQWTVDLGDRRNVELQLNERRYDLLDVPVPQYDERYAALDSLLNLYLSVRTNAPVRNFIWFDSILISVDW